MPKNQVSDPITDQEIAFAHLVLSGTMTDRRAAEAVGLNPDTAAYTKAKPRVRAYMLQHRAAVHERLVEQETGGLRRLNLGREQVLDRLWEIANLSPEMTRGSVSFQVKALSMIVAIEGLIPDRRAVSSEKKSAPPPIGGKSIPPLGFASSKGRAPIPVRLSRRAVERRGRRAVGPWPCPRPCVRPQRTDLCSRTLKPLENDPTVASCPRAQFCSRQPGPFL